MPKFFFERITQLDGDSCFAKISSSLRGIGFVLLSYVDMKEILKKNFGTDMEPYYIMEVCKPGAAREMIGRNENYGLFLPCKITIIQKGKSSRVLLARVSAMAEDYLGDDPSVARKYEEELIQMISTL